MNLPINRNTLFYGLGLVLMKGIAFLMLPIYTRYLSTYEYGQLEVLVTFTNLMSLIIGMGLIESLYRFTGGKKQVDRQRVISTVMVLTAVISLVFLGLMHLVGQTVSTLIPGEIPLLWLQWISVSLCLSAIITIPLTWLRMNDRAVEFFIATVTVAVIQSGLSFYLLVHDHGVMSIVWSGIIATSIMLCIVMLRIRSDLSFAWRTAEIKQLLKYGWPFIISGFAGFILSGADRWLLADLFDLETLAVYAIAAKFAFLPVMLMQPYALWWYPKRFNYLSGKNQLVSNARHSVMGAVLAVLTCGMTGLAAPLIIRWLTPIEYHDAIELLPLFLTAVAMKICSEYLNMGCFINNSSYQQMLIDVFASACGLILMVWLAHTIGLIGILVALNIAYLIRLMLFFVLSQKILSLPYQLDRLYLSALASICMLVIGQWMFMV